LVGLELEQGKRQRAAEKMEEFRKDLQFAKASAWSAVLVKNWQAFKALRQKAAASPHGQTPCTLCDGTGHMDHCVLCHDSGKCPTCGGTGKAAHEEYCPTCQGKGSCYLCRGSKGMTCPFCDDGTVDVKGPVPPGMPPLN
jgi:DnaJ-class molecular chaperone